MVKKKKTSSSVSSLSSLLVEKGRKKFGDDSVTTRGQESLSEIPDFISTQCIAIDAAIGHPGIPVGRLTVIQGKEASGKTTIVTQILAECQRRGGISIYLDAEDAFETEHAADLGLYDEEQMERRGVEGVEPLIILHPEHIPDAFSKIEFYIKAVREVDPDRLVCIAWDSVAATPTSVEADEENYDNKQPGVAARQVSQGLRRLTKIVAENKIALICVNQIKEKIITGFGGFGDKTATIASAPLGFHATIRMVVAHIGFLDNKKRSEAKGIVSSVKVNKNKIAPPHREADFNIVYATGIDNNAAILDLAKKFGLVKVTGSYLKYGDNQFQKKNWPDVDFFNNVLDDVKSGILKRQQEALSKWTPEEDDDDEDDDLAPRKKPKQLEEDD